MTFISIFAFFKFIISLFYLIRIMIDRDFYLNFVVSMIIVILKLIICLYYLIIRTCDINYGFSVS